MLVLTFSSFSLLRLSLSFLLGFSPHLWQTNWLILQHATNTWCLNISVLWRLLDFITFFWLPLCASYKHSHKDWAKQGSKNKEWEQGSLILYHHHAQTAIKSSWWPFRSTLGFSISKFGTRLQIRIWQELYKVYSSYNQDNLHNNSSYQETLDSATCTICRSLQWRITFAADGRRWGSWSFTIMTFSW